MSATGVGDYPLLFSPLRIAGLEARNRIVMAPMGTGLPEHDGTCNERTIAYYRRRAEGGVGMVTVEASLVSPDAHGVGPELRLHGAQFVPGLRRLVDALRPYAIPVGIQLWHPGRQTLLGEPIGPSAVPLSSRTPVPRALTVEQIRDYVEWYALAAAIAQEAGFDYVEVHGAHCYLPCEFISPLSNLRDDEYGGSLENRARFPLEIVQAIRERCGPDYPISYRISGEEGADGGFTLEDSTRVARWLVEAGVDTISVSAGNWYALHLTIGADVPPARLPAGARARDQGGGVGAGGRRRPARRSRPRRAGARGGRRRPDRRRTRPDRRSRLAREGQERAPRRHPSVHRLQRVRRSRRPGRGGAVRGQPRGRQRARLGVWRRPRRRGA